MKPEAQQVAIAQAFGWRKCIFSDRYGTAFGSPPGEALTYREKLPDYLTDLNAMHEAERILTPEQRVPYADALAKVCRIGISENGTWWTLATATAAQRAEALLRTIGKWEE